MQIELTQGRVAIVSAEDYGDLSRFKWHAARCGSGKVYARRGEQRDGRSVGVFMHRHVMARHLADGLVVDHINGDSLDNRRENLRVVTASANARNLRRFPGSSAGFRGVFAAKGGFAARIGPDYLGFFETDLEAAFAVNLKLNELDGAIGLRNPIDYPALIRVLTARRDVIEQQIRRVEEAASGLAK